MASKTTNYGLNKHSPQDFYNVEARNENWDKIDEALAATDPTKITAKAAPADGDGVMIADSADGGKAKRLLWSNVKAALGRLFVPLARKINGKALSADVTLTGENIAVSTTDSTPISGALKYRCNPNLLDNWFFGRPVNQRGQTEWASSASAYVPCVDRWNWWGQYVAGSTLKLLDDGLQLIGEPNVAGLYQYISQKIEKDRLLIGAAVTLSVLVKSESDASIILSIDGENYTIVAVQANVWELITYTFNAPSVEQTYNISIQRNTAGTTFTVKAAKLELGDTQTLAHKENGAWVLNEIPDFGEQLRRCVYYAEKIEDGNTPVITNATFIPAGATSATFVLPYERKRTSPSIRFNDVSNYRVIVRSMSGNTSAFGISNISILDVGTTKASVLVTFSSATSQDWYGYLQRADNTSGGYAFISADL